MVGYHQPQPLHREPNSTFHPLIITFGAKLHHLSLQNRANPPSSKMTVEGIATIAKNLTSMQLDYQQNVRSTVAATASTALTTEASSSSHKTQSPCIDVGAKENTPPRDSCIPNFNCELSVPTFEPSKLAANDHGPTRQVRKWKLKQRREKITQQPKVELVTMHAVATDVRHEPSPPSPPSATGSWATFLFETLATPAPQPPQVAHDHVSSIRSPNTPPRRRFDEDTIANSAVPPLLPCLKPEERTSGHSIDCPLPRRRIFNLRRRLIDRPSPLQKKVRRDN